MIRRLFFFALLPVCAAAQESPVIAPTWETQTHARKYLLGIPGPRGQITDRNGQPLAQNRVAHSLCVVFPSPPTMKDAEAITYARRQIAKAENILSRKINVSNEEIVRHYRNRALLPMEILQNLMPAEMTALKEVPDGLFLRPVYVRFYPNGSLAGHVIGYTGRRSGLPDRPIQNNDLLWPDTQGREGLEQVFDEQLAGRVGQMNLTFDQAGNQISEVIAIPPEPGNNVITTLDEALQRKCEEILAERTKRGAIVVLDPRNGDILALASWPVFNPNDFVPFISTEHFKRLQDDEDVPLLPRAFRSAYPPGSTFKTFSGLAALESKAVTPSTLLPCPPSFTLGKFTFRNWKKEHAGDLNFARALTQSCNTWFYQVGLRTGGKAIIEWATSLGLGKKTGIPLTSEVEGRIPTDEYMQRVHNRRILDGDVVNMSIGQGDILVSPLQMAQAMGVIANGGTLFQSRLVSHVQKHGDEIVSAYNVRAKANLAISPSTIAEIHRGLVDVVSSGSGTAARARVPGVKVAGKTGTAQWGPKDRQRIAAWFAGFAPAENAEVAFAAVYEGEPGVRSVGGGTHAAPLIGELLRDYFEKRKAERAEAAGETEEEPAPQQEPEPEFEEPVVPASIPINIPEYDLSN
jgi:penicillin-binding protein 2